MDFYTFSFAEGGSGFSASGRPMDAAGQWSDEAVLTVRANQFPQPTELVGKKYSAMESGRVVVELDFYRRLRCLKIKIENGLRNERKINTK